MSKILALRTFCRGLISFGLADFLLTASSGRSRVSENRDLPQERLINRFICSRIVLPYLIVIVGLTFPLTLRAQETVTPLIVTTPTPSVIPIPTSSTPSPNADPSSTPTSEAASGIYSFASPGGYYPVQQGDTLLSVALEVGVDLADAYCLVAPDFNWVQPLVIGDLLTLPPPGTFCHEVVDGDSIDSIAAQYKVASEAILGEEWNQLATGDGNLSPGMHLRVPTRMQDEIVAELEIPVGNTDNVTTGVLPLLLSQPVNANVAQVMAVGRAFSTGEAPPVGSPRASTIAPVPADWPYGSGSFSWPLAGWMTQGYLSDHRAVDVAAPIGTVVTAADRGEVIRAGWNDQGYGLFVIIDHNIDYITLYAHLSEVMVEEGDVVAAGQPLGLVGSSGNSTGPHLHFEIRDFGRRIDPLSLLLH